MFIILDPKFPHKGKKSLSQRCPDIRQELRPEFQGLSLLHHHVHLKDMSPVGEKCKIMFLLLTLPLCVRINVRSYFLDLFSFQTWVHVAMSVTTGIADSQFQPRFRKTIATVPREHGEILGHPTYWIFKQVWHLEVNYIKSIAITPILISKNWKKF